MKIQMLFQTFGGAHTVAHRQTRQCDTLSLRLRHIAGTHVATTDNLSVLVFFFVFLFEFTFFCAKFRFGVDAG